MRPFFRRTPRQRDGFTVVELTVVVVILGVLTAFAVPRFMDSVERSRAAEAFNFLASVRGAEERYHARHGTYAGDVAELETKIPTPAYFAVGSIGVPLAASGLASGWELALTRSDASGGYGTYSVIFNQEGFDKTDSTIPDVVNPFRAP